MSSVNGNDVKEVRVSEASRRDARGQPDKDTVLKAVAELESERLAYDARKGQIEARLAGIKNQIRGRSLPQPLYDRLTNEQTQLVQELKDIQGKLAQTRLQRLRLLSDLRDIEKPDKLAETNLILRAILRELRKKRDEK